MWLLDFIFLLLLLFFPFLLLVSPTWTKNVCVQFKSLLCPFVFYSLFLWFLLAWLEPSCCVFIYILIAGDWRATLHQDRVSASVVLSSTVFFVRFMPCTSSFLILHLASPTVSELVYILIHCTLCRTRYENGMYRLLGKNYSKFLHCFKSKDK